MKLSDRTRLICQHISRRSAKTKQKIAGAVNLHFLKMPQTKHPRIGISGPLVWLLPVHMWRSRRQVNFSDLCGSWSEHWGSTDQLINYSNKRKLAFIIIYLWFIQIFIMLMCIKCIFYFEWCCFFIVHNQNVQLVNFLIVSAWLIHLRTLKSFITWCSLIVKYIVNLSKSHQR